MIKRIIFITALDVIYHRVFYLKHNVSETGFCLRLEVEPTQSDPIVRAILYLLPETESSLRNFVF
jgi:hypothetical protein